jgi:hypothetical protein
MAIKPETAINGHNGRNRKPLIQAGFSPWPIKAVIQICWPQAIFCVQTGHLRPLTKAIIPKIQQFFKHKLNHPPTLSDPTRREPKRPLRLHAGRLHVAAQKYFLEVRRANRQTPRTTKGSAIKKKYKICK